MEEGNYPGYKEPAINFLPSYKMDKKKPIYVDKKDQAPSYCDRIIYKNNSELKIEEEKYDCLHQVTGSDHRPVILSLKIRNFDEPQFCSLGSLLKKRSLGYGEFDLELVDIQGLSFEKMRSLNKVDWDHVNHNLSLRVSFYDWSLDTLNSPITFSKERKLRIEELKMQV